LTGSSFALYRANLANVTGTLAAANGGTGQTSFPLYPSTTGLTCRAGGGQGSATALSVGLNVVSTCASNGDSLLLPTTAAGKISEVQNLGAAIAALFPPSGSQIDGNSANASTNIAAGDFIRCEAVSSTRWNCSTSIIQNSSNIKLITGSLTVSGALAGSSSGFTIPGSVTIQNGGQLYFSSTTSGNNKIYFASNKALGLTLGDDSTTNTAMSFDSTTSANVINASWLFAFSKTDSITAHAGGGQASATSCTTQQCNLTTVGSAGDSVKIVTAARRAPVVVCNTTATSANAFPQSGENLGAGTDTAVAVAGTSCKEFFSTSSTTYLNK